MIQPLNFGEDGLVCILLWVMQVGSSIFCFIMSELTYEMSTVVL